MEIALGRRIILLIKSGDEVLAFQGLCPHQQARLAEGALQNGTIQCPRHLASFELQDGACTGGWQLPPLKRYVVKVEGDDILLSDPLQEII